jgi:ABC-type Mn2+/Zn2+ transport system permease subunit
MTRREVLKRRNTKNIVIATITLISLYILQIILSQIIYSIDPDIIDIIKELRGFDLTEYKHYFINSMAMIKIAQIGLVGVILVNLIDMIRNRSKNKK